MPETKDTLLEDAMRDLKRGKVKSSHVVQNKTNRQQKRAMDSLKSMIIIAKLRQNGWDWIRMAKRLNVSEQTIRNWATGKNTPHPNNLIALKRLKNGEDDLPPQKPEGDRVED